MTMDLHDSSLRCLYCGGDPFEPDHETHCDGRQGGRDEDPPITSIPRHRETSIAAFYNSLHDGLITKRKQQVYTCLQEIGPATMNETIDVVQRRYPAKGQSLRPRFSELRDDGLIREVGERACRITGVVCVLWECVPQAEYVPPLLVKRVCPYCGSVHGREVKES
jgi:hypothetical protein